MGGGQLVVVGMLLSTSRAGELVTCRPGHVPSKEVTYPADNLSGVAICEPCVETSTAYYGNNINLTPHYGVDNYRDCRTLCRQEDRCEYFTYDSEIDWCYLKTAKTASTNGDIGDKKYTSGPKSEDCQSDEENEIQDSKEPAVFPEEERALAKVTLSTVANVTESDSLDTIKEDQEVTNTTNRFKPRTPILSVFHEDGSRTVLTALPATFGLSIANDTEELGRLVLIRSSLCSPQPSIRLRPWLLGWKGDSSTKVFAAVRRGDCRFSQKAENAANAGFAGLVILDDQSDTDTPRISGIHSEHLDSFPVIFLLKTEARILEKHLMESSSLSMAIQDSSSFSWYSRRLSTTTKKTPEKIGRQKFLLGMRDPMDWFHRPFSTSPSPSSSFSSSQKGVEDKKTVSGHPLDSPRSGGVLHMTPLTLGSLIVAVMVLLLLITSVTTLLVSRYTRRRRRKANHTRCQLAIRNMEAQGSGSHDNSGFSGGEEGRAGAGRGLPKSARNLLECPVCLELAWPPRKIYQCREGHIVCDQCKANPALKLCPMCRIPLASNLTSRNRQLEELARTLKEEDDGVEPSAPPLASFADLTLTSSPPIPVTVFTVTASVQIEPTSPSIELEPEEQEEGIEYHRITTSVAAGPLTVILPPEYHPEPHQ